MLELSYITKLNGGFVKEVLELITNDRVPLKLKR